MFAPIDCYLHNNLKIGYIMHFMMVDQLLTYLQKHYRPEDYPVIRAQYADFESRKPFAGLKILEATPLFQYDCQIFTTYCRWSSGDTLPYQRCAF